MQRMSLSLKRNIPIWNCKCMHASKRWNGEWWNNGEWLSTFFSDWFLPFRIDETKNCNVTPDYHLKWYHIATLFYFRAKKNSITIFVFYFKKSFRRIIMNQLFARYEASKQNKVFNKIKWICESSFCVIVIFDSFYKSKSKEGKTF